MSTRSPSLRSGLPHARTAALGPGLLHVDVEDQCGVRRDVRRGALAAVGQVGRDDELAAAALAHAGHALGPARDHLAGADLGLERLPGFLLALPGAVELLAVAKQHADILDRHGVALLGACSLPDDQVLR